MKASQRGQTTLVIFYRSGSVAQVILHITNPFTILQEAFETAAQIKKELKITEFQGAFCQKNSNF